MPPLRERVEDIPPLVDHFLSLLAARYRRDRKTVSREALRKLCAQPWPGNVRQLEHVLLNAWLMSDGGEIGVDDLELPRAVAPRRRDGRARPRRASRPPSPPARREPGRVQGGRARAHPLAPSRPATGTASKAAEMIGVPRRTFYRRLKEFGLL